jgi:hypothetical protein
MGRPTSLSSSLLSLLAPVPPLLPHRAGDLRGVYGILLYGWEAKSSGIKSAFLFWSEQDICGAPALDKPLGTEWDEYGLWRGNVFVPTCYLV